MNSASRRKRTPNPRQNANILSVATFFYTLPTFIKGYKKNFSDNDLYETLADCQSERLGSKVEVLWNDELDKAKRAGRRPSLTKVLIASFGFEYICLGLIISVVELIVKPAQAVFLGRLLLYYMPAEEGRSHTTLFEARLYAGGIVLSSFVRVLIYHPFLVQVKMVGLKVKIACCALIYRKALRLSNEGFVHTSVGQMVNLLSNDVITFTFCALLLNYLWISPIQCVIITYLLYRDIGFSSIFGVLLLCMFVPIYHLLGKAVSKFKLKAALRADARVCYMNEIILGIKIIKMYAWEKLVTKILFSLRRLELKYIRLCSYIRATYVTFDILIIPIALYVTIISYALHNDIRTDQVFTMIVFYNTMRACMAVIFPQALGLRAEALVSIERINTFLLNAEIDLKSIENTKEPVAVKITDGNARWQAEVTLKDVNVTVKPEIVTAIVGHVGCGKSSLLSVILKELPLDSGDIKINGTISYASQDAWLFSGSIRDNILFGESMDVERYNEVVRVCALECDFNSLPFADNTLVGGRGASLSGGQKARINLARAVYRDADIYLLDEPFAAVDTSVGQQIFEECIEKFLKLKTVILVTHQLKYLKNVDEIIVLEKGSVKSQCEFVESELAKISSDCNNEAPSEHLNQIQQSKDYVPEVVKEQQSVGSVSKRVYKKYINDNGIFSNVIVFLLFLLTQALLSGGSYFLAYWSNWAQNNVYNISETIDYKNSKNTHITVYSIITVACIITIPLRSYLFYSLLVKSSQRLHNNMFKNIINGTMHFFNTNSQGRIINRFSQDIGLVDSHLPTVAINTAQSLLSAVASILLISMVNWWFLIPAVVMGILSYCLKEFCLLTSRNIKRLEGVTRSPVFEHISSSLQGLSTIRAFRAEAMLKGEFDAHQDLHSCCFHLFLSTSEGFGYFLDILCVLFIAVVTLAFVVADTETLSGNVGLAISQCLALVGILQWAVQQMAELETNMTAVERILEYDSIEQDDHVGEEVDKSWPQHGEIVFRNVSLSYSQNGPVVLNNLNFTVLPGEKIGIIGRTGAGKSSIVNALLRLSYISGDILIDGVNIKTVQLQELRSKISVIPQDAVLFSGTIRTNLDPFERFDDEELWKVLREVELKKFVLSLPQGLSHLINQGGTNLSAGQRQLICLARALLYNNKILIMDEATANVDVECDNLLQQTIRRKFKDCTVLTIAHRLETIMDSDKVLVLNAGEIVEFEKLSVLLQNSSGYLYAMIQKLDKTDRWLTNTFQHF